MRINEMFYRDWSVLVHTAAAAALSFIVLVILLRFFGKKMLLTTSAGSFAITVALGNALATAALDESIGLAETATGFVMLMTLQWTLFKLAGKFHWLERMMRSSAVVVFFEGKPLPEALGNQRVAMEDVHAAIREHGYPEVDLVGAVVFERSGELSAIPRSDDSSYPFLEPLLKEVKR